MTRAAAPTLAPHTPSRGAGLTVNIRIYAGRFWKAFLVWSAAHIPWFIGASGPFFLWFAWRFARSVREPALINARRILGDQSTLTEQTRLGKATTANFCRFIADIGRNGRRSSKEILGDIDSIDGLDTYNAARAHRRGAIIAAAHMGPFETSVAGLRQYEPKVHVVFRRDTIPSLESLRHQLHQRLGVIEAPVDTAGDALGPWIGLRDALKNNEVVLLQADRVMHGQRGIRVPFLTGHMEFPPGPIKLAIASGAPIIPVFSFWLPSGLTKVIIEPAIEVRSPWTRDSVHPALIEYAHILERHVRQRPDQWLMFQPVLCEDAEGGSL